MFLVMHSLSGALRYFGTSVEPTENNKSIQNLEKIISDLQEENVCPTCKNCLDVIAPLPSEELKRRSSAHNAYSTYNSDTTVDLLPKTRGLRIVRTRHKSDNPTSRLVEVTSKSSHSLAKTRLGLIRNPSDPKFDTVSGDEMGSGQNVSALPRTLSTSVLRIKQRRSFWEKFVK